LIQKMIDEKNGGEKTQKPTKKEQKLYHCEDIDDYGTIYIEHKHHSHED
jgi:hypothetical protein